MKIANTRIGTSVRSFQEVDPFYDNVSLLLHMRGDNGSTTLIDSSKDDVRITKGVARYTANFTPPTQAFPRER